jgi:hypothetical protein
MSSRRRVKPTRNRRGPRTGGIDLDDLDGALKTVVLGGGGGNNSDSSSPSLSLSPSREENVKVTIDSAKERRFVMRTNNNERSSGSGIFSNHNDTSTNFDDGNFANNHTSNFATHQENFSATKYIKP